MWWSQLELSRIRWSWIDPGWSESSRGGLSPMKPSRLEVIQIGWNRVGSRQVEFWWSSGGV